MYVLLVVVILPVTDSFRIPLPVFDVETTVVAPQITSAQVITTTYPTTSPTTVVIALPTTVRTPAAVVYTTTAVRAMRFTRARSSNRIATTFAARIASTTVATTVTATISSTTIATPFITTATTVSTTAPTAVTTSASTVTTTVYTTASVLITAPTLPAPFDWLTFERILATIPEGNETMEENGKYEGDGSDLLAALPIADLSTGGGPDMLYGPSVMLTSVPSEFREMPVPGIKSDWAYNSNVTSDGFSWELLTTPAGLQLVCNLITAAGELFYIYL